jgi:hypothetical protein
MPRNKSSRELIVIETKSTLNTGVKETISELEIPLAQKIDEYVLKLGYSNAHVLGVLVQLLTGGKVRVDFRDYTERLQLHDADDMMTRADAVALFDEHMQTLNKSGGGDEGINVTQKIVVQMPKIGLPRK